MHPVVGDRYVLAVGDTATARLVDEVYGLATRQSISDAGLQPGMRVADLGCGTGILTRWLAEQAGSTGEVVGLDASGKQLSVAGAMQGSVGSAKLTFREGSVYETGLPRGSFDMVCCRFLLCHLLRPLDALQEMRALLRPGGALVCQDMDLLSLINEPANCACRRSVELSLALADIRGVDYCFGARLEDSAREAGFEALQATAEQPWFLRGEGKRLWEYTFLEAAPAMVDADLVRQREVDQLAAELASAAKHENTLLATWMMFGVSGRKRV
jgi:SAM-dependent methyltransferase